MKKFICILLVMALTCAACFALAGCNRQIIDTTWSFERAIIFLPDGEKIEGKVNSWGNYDNSNMIQVSVDGKMYLTHSSNVVLISD